MTGGKVETVLEQYKAICKELKKVTKHSVLTHERRLVDDKKNPKRLFSYVRSKQSVVKTITALNCGEDITYSRKEISENLNNYFKSVFVQEQSNDQLPIFGHRTDSKIDQVTIDIEDLAKRLGNLEACSAPGEDGIHPTVLKHCNIAMARPLSEIYRRSMATGIVPEKWKLANVTPLHKKGSRLESSNYRPVSLTSVVCKVLERIVRDAVMEHLLSNKLLAAEQHGFVPKKSCTTNLLETFDFITKSLAAKRAVDVVFLDFAKAFDKVPHKRLVHKLRAYGIVGKLLDWISEFLRNRKQRVVLGENTSEWASVDSGVPQGSVLGPILFLLYINDLPECVKFAICKLYADDSKLLANVETDEDRLRLQEDLNRIVDWTNTWLMKLNYSKCKIMHIGKRNPKSTYSMSDSSDGRSYQLSATDTEKDLGVTVSSDMKWHKQVVAVSNKGNSVLGWMKGAFMSRDAQLWKKLYITYIRPQLEFAAPVWNPFLSGDIKTLERVQRRATKVAHELRGLSYPERLDCLGLTSLQLRRERGDCLQNFKIINGLEEVKLTAYRSSTSSRTSRRGKSRMKRELVRNCEPRHHFLTNRVVNRWNNLPAKAITASSVNVFKAEFDAAYK